MQTLIKPFRALRPVPERTADVIAPPYDVLDSAEARQRAAGRPHSFLHISKPEIDLPPDTDPYSPAVYARGAENLARLIDAGVLVRDARPCYYAYRLRMGSHVQTGLGCVASVADYDSNRIRKHEHTRPDKEDDRVRQITALGAQTGPVLLAWRSHAGLADMLARVADGPAACEVTADDGIVHGIWVIDDPALIDRITGIVDGMTALYIADGHHRSAAASRVAATRRAEGAAEGGGHDHFLTVAFPHDEMRILDYNRVVRDLNGLTAAAFLERVAQHFTVTPADGPASPDAPGRFGMYLGGRWYALAIHGGRVPTDPVARLDVSLLQDHLLAPLLGIGDPRRDRRIDFVGGIRGLGELERRVDSGEMAVAFALHPTSLEALMAVADANQVMPPKSTWFEPKLADGLLSHLLD